MNFEQICQDQSSAFKLIQIFRNKNSKRALQALLNSKETLCIKDVQTLGGIANHAAASLVIKQLEEYNIVSTHSNVEGRNGNKVYITFHPEPIAAIVDWIQSGINLSLTLKSTK